MAVRTLAGSGAKAVVGMSSWPSFVAHRKKFRTRAVVGTATFIALIGRIATWLPARRAIRVHPTIALRGG
jgi:ABC-type antimicrobial peptide transport system permease subunit